MSRNTNDRFVKPMLENLEERAMPAVLLGAVQQLVTPLNNIVSDMKSASTDLQAQFTLIKNNTPPTNTFSGAEVVADKAVADWQRILSDSAAIKATVTVELTVLQSVAFAELTAGDSTDALLLFLGPLIGLNVTKPLSDTVTQSSNILNDTTLQGIVNTNLHTLNIHVDSTTPIVQETFPVTF
jgi:hypothetical protein